MFLLTKDGQPKEMIPSAGHDISIYADCFVVMGMAEYARAAGDQDALQTAQKLYAHIESRFQAGKVRSEPYPIPEGYDAHGFAMIMLNTSQALAKAAEDMTGQERSLYRNQAWFYAGRILSGFCDSEHRIREVVPKSKAGEDSAGTLLLRHLNPGHTVESLWFVMEEAALRQDHEALQLAVKALKRALQLGWDEAFGGLLRYVDVDGGPPKGDDISGGERFEKLIRETWDTKLWWPHSEGLYACRLAFELTGDADCLAWYEKLHEYTFNTFPAAPGEEWLQIRDRRGEPIAQVVALPVKDPYHVMRNVMLMIELTAAE
ncbi:hypothetical protein GCM10010916_48460 [Paenibacillus abyssi]|uniref:N-acyl-D-glucosamine 2-epimerase n=2 Tax=Paenibacillus abyssi TaxID=1340531 RepID=A0A917G7T8_9BACL|nr:hypothetical protein GCM10010916_48460 [Paenibacillus abyssi]